MSIVRYIVLIGLMLHAVKSSAMNRFMHEGNGGAVTPLLSLGAQKLEDQAASAERLSQFYRKLASTNGKLESLKQQELNAKQLASSLTASGGSVASVSTAASTASNSVIPKGTVRAPATLQKITVAVCYMALAVLLWKFFDKAWDIASGDCQTEPRAVAVCQGLSSTATTAAALVAGAALVGAASSLAVGARVGKSAVIDGVNSIGTTVADGVAWVVASDEEDAL